MCHQQFTFVLLSDMVSLQIIMCIMFVCVLACLRSAFIPDLLYPNKSACHPLMITTHHQHSVIPSWSTLFSPIPLEDYSRVPPALPAWLSSTSHIDRANIKRVFRFNFSRLTACKKKYEKYHKTFYPCVKSICLPKCSCRYAAKMPAAPHLYSTV